MNIGFAFRRGDTDGLIFDYTSESTHCMSFEMRQVNHEIIVLQMGSDDVILDMFFIFYRNIEFTFRIHDVNLCYVEETMVFNCLDMLFCRKAFSDIGRIAFYYCPAYFLH